MTEQDRLNEYFSKIWNEQPERISKWEYSGEKIIEKISSKELVLDVGCGRNYYKKFFPNLIGIDPAFNEADIKTTIEDFKTNIKFDVAICFGSIQFGNVKKITNQISKIVSILKPVSRIYWRCHPGIPPGAKWAQHVDNILWTEELIEYFANKFNYKIQCITYETNRKQNQKRLYSEWIRD